jgi:iron complex transport system permease protein
VRRLSDRQLYLILSIVLAAVALVSASVGAYSYSLPQMLRYTGQGLGWIPASSTDEIQRSVFLTLRLPRVILSALTGGVLGLSGALMQGLFRNPIVEPGLAGTSAGAAFGAALVFVFGTTTMAFTSPLGTLAVPAVAFVGSFLATLLVYRISSSFGKVNVFTLLLAGIAVNAVCGAGTGFLSYIARDPQARNITFWSLGTFTGADWRSVELVGACFVVAFFWIRRYGKALNALMLGEDEAALLGINPQSMIFSLLIANTIMVATATAAVGVIAFVGLVVPHMIRMARGPSYTFLLSASALLGAVLLCGIDVIARVIIPPAELPIGIITAVVGAPVFLTILLRDQRRGLAGIYG